MYYFFGIFLVILLFFALLNHYRAKCIRKKICALSCCEKTEQLNELICPFGFSYSFRQDLFSSRLDAWQRDFGYCTLYDQVSPHIQLVFDCEPIYFDYEGRTWLIELWKGQYGINTGAEIGVYHAETLLVPREYSRTLFQAAEDRELLDLSMELWEEDELLFRNSRQHWWLTGFCMGHFSCPHDLTLKVSITFPDFEMMDSFLQSLTKLGYSRGSYSIHCTTVVFCFCRPHSTQPCQSCPLICRFSQWKNRCFCRIFRWVTRPFCNSADRLLYLYYFLPFAFRKTIQFCKPRRYRPGKKERGMKKRPGKKTQKMGKDPQKNPRGMRRRPGK